MSLPIMQYILLRKMRISNRNSIYFYLFLTNFEFVYLYSIYINKKKTISKKSAEAFVL